MGILRLCGGLDQSWSLETWSRSRDVSRDPFFGVSVLKVSGLGLEGFRCRSRALRLETLYRLFFCEALQGVP